MITNKMIRLFFTIAVFLLVMAKGQRNCSLWIRYNSAANMPIAYRVNANHEAFVIYPNSNGRLLVEYDTQITLSCINSRFVLADLAKFRDINVTCVAHSLVRYQVKTYEYADLKCQSNPKPLVVVTDRPCKPKNGTVITVGFDTEDYYFTLYSACFDMIAKNTIYTWYNVRSPYYNKHETRPRSRLFTKVSSIYDPLDVEIRYNVKSQTTTLNGILNLPTDSRKIINSTNFLTRGHLASMPEFYYAREQRATFNYINVAPQWFHLNEYWSVVENEFRSRLTVNRRCFRRVIVSGIYGQLTLPDSNNVQQPLYLAMPEKQVIVPMFLWRIYYDADDKNSSFVYIGLNSPFATKKEVEDKKLRCDEIPCPWPSIIKSYKTNALHLYCCTIGSFERVYSKFNPDVFHVPQMAPTA